MMRPLIIASLVTLVFGASQSTRAAVGVTVWTTSGLPVYDIDCRRFELRVGSALRPIARCSPAPPLTIALLFDASGSFPYDLSVKAIVEEVASRLREGDRLSVGWFGADTQLPDDYTRDASRLKTAADRADRAVKAAKGPSPLWDAVVATLAKLTPQPGRKALITFTDGWATGNRTAFGLSALEIVRSGVEIHAVGARVPGADNFEPFVDPELRARQLRLWTLARASGGTASLPGATFQYLKPTLQTIVDELQRGILLEFESLPTDTGVQPLSVRITTPGFIVRAPDRYAAR
jgi:hypothetical protein